MNTNVKGNNKGFSLVELIVVMAIMAILAVTLAPRLSQYVEKSRMASDQEAVNTIFSAAKLANVQYPNDMKDSPDGLATAGEWDLGGTADSTLFNVTDGEEWELSTAFVTTDTDHKFVDEMAATLSSFKLKSEKVDGATSIFITRSTDGLLSVTLDYDGAGYDESKGDYVVTE